MPDPGYMAQAHRQEAFANAFLGAIASVAGCTLAKPATDNESVDWILSCKLAPKRPRLDVQLKSWTGDSGHGETIKYPLDKKNYDDLILNNPLVPRILVLVTMRPNLSKWLSLTPRALTLRRCAYWCSLRGWPASANATSVTVAIPRANVFTVETLRAMMARINDGGVP
jgi:hypothetical protein